MRLLVVEDNIELAQAIGDAFAARHLHCDLAHNAGDADILIRTTRYALVILDLGLPDEDGLDLLKRLRAAQRSEPIIILTARGEVENRIRGLSAGADDYMSKPFHFDELHARVLAILRRDSGIRTGCSAPARSNSIPRRGSFAPRARRWNFRCARVNYSSC